MGRRAALMVLLVLAAARAQQQQQQPQYVGRALGALSQLHHGVRGQVFAVDARTLFLRDFHYDGEGPAAYFYVGSGGRPSAADGVRLRDERGGAGPLRRYRGEGVTLALPDGKTLKDIRWFAVWCDEYSVNFGDVVIPAGAEYPRPARVAALRGVHGVSSDPVVVVDAQTLLVPNFSYDGEAPDAKFWVGRGDKPSPAGIRIPDENGKEAPLRKYDKKTIVLTLPGELTVFDIGHFAVWCEAFTVNFGHVTLPRALLQNVPPSLKMLGVSPQSKLNCEVLHDELAFEVRWAVAGDSIVLQLVAKLEDGEYMSFGVSGDAAHSQMVGGDVAVAWVDKHTLKGYAVDYYLDAKSQCAGVRGSCPDERLGAKTDSIRLLNAALVNGYSIVTYQRALRAADQLDRPVLVNGSQPVIWALGPLNSRQEVSYHHHFTKGDLLIEFGRPPLWNCPMPEGEEGEEPRTDAPPTTRAPLPLPAAPLQRQPNTEQEKQPSRVVLKPNPVPTPAPAPRAVPWEIPPIACYEPPDGVFYAQMGPTGGKQGYSAITGHVGWGISWYINGLLIPEVTVVRGRKYTFVVEGGSDPDVPARYHPFYITNDPVGGYYHKNEDEKKGVEIYAGVRRSRGGEPVPTGVGRLCNWTPDAAGPEADAFPSFGAYQRSLTLVCEEGAPGVVTWTPDAHTPDTVYYQCFTHRHLGWKIHVVDSCDEEAEESRPAGVAVPPPAGAAGAAGASGVDDLTTDLTPDESIQVATRLRPDSNFLDERRKVAKIINTKTTYNDFSSDKDRPQDVLSGEQPVMSRGQIQDVITTIESLETHMRDAAAPASRDRTPPAPPAPPALRPAHAHQYQVHEEPDAAPAPAPERPFRESDEYTVQGGRPHAPHNYFLPPGAHPLTLQTVLRPAGAGANKRPPFRRPAPPEIKLRRPLPAAPSEGKLRRPPLATPSGHPTPPGLMHGLSHGKPTPSFPLAMPGHHGPYHMKHFYVKPNFNRSPPGPSPRPQHSAPPAGTGPLPPHPPPPKPTFGPPKVVHKQPAPQQTGIIMGKPGPAQIAPPLQSQTLSLGHTDIIANQVVKSHITLPGNGDSITSSSIQQSFINQPGQIILGKPMDHPVPLDQQMTPSRHHIVTMPTTSIPEPKREPARVKYEAQVHPPAPQDDVKSSDFIGESTESSTMQPAVNTGFKPNTIVIESGFKPIIREPLMDRTDHDVVNHNRRQDSDVEEDYEESPQPITNYAYQTPSEKLTESFEPMFIPSPVDMGIPPNDRTKEVFPSNHAKEDRPHPVYVKTESELNALFGKKNMNKEVPEDMIMEADRVSPQYLPPDPKLPKEHSQKITNTEQTFTTYDGKTVSAATLTSIPDNKDKNKQGTLIFTDVSSAINSMFTKNLLLKPQFGPFKGQIPSVVAESIKDLNSSESEKPIDSKTTVLLPKLDDILRTAATVLDEVEVAPPRENITKYEDDYYENYEDTTANGAYEEAEEKSENNDRTKREVPGYHTFLREVREIKNQIDFQADAQSTAPRISWSSLLLLPLLLKLI